MTGARVIAIVEDEDTIREAVAVSLRREGYQLETYGDGAAAWEAFARALPDLVVLDIGLPRMDGLEICRRLRAKSLALPIIFVTSREDEFDRVLGLEIGADDYLCKPFSMRELIARIRVLFRRTSVADDARSDEDRPVSIGPLRLDPVRLEATWRETRVSLTVTEFLLLSSIARRPGHVKSREQLMNDAYSDGTHVSDRTIDSHIKRIRRKLEDVDSTFTAIESVYGAGYRYRSHE